MKVKDLQSPWITKGIKNSSKGTQRPYENFLKKKRNRNNELDYKNYKTLFEAIKKCSKKFNLSNLILKYKDSTKKTWKVIQEFKNL